MGEALRMTGIVFGYILFYLTMFLGVIVIPVGLPGQFLVAAAVLVFTLAGGSILPWWVFAICLGLAILAEVLEAVSGFAGAKKAKGSAWSALGAIAGGLAGAILGTAIPIPVVGSVVGAFAGTFGGAYGVEYYRTRKHDASRTVAKGALVGRIVGTVAKIGCAMAMIALTTAILVFRAIR